MMRRRELIAGVASVAALTLSRAARAQQDQRMRLLGVLHAGPQGDPGIQSSRAAFMQGMQALGWSEGRNLAIEDRFPNGRFDEITRFAKELVALRPDAIFASTGAPGVRALMQETRTIPIVFSGASDPVAQGFVESLAKPGGNVTGFAIYEGTLGLKWLELLKRIAPNVRRVALVFNPQSASPAVYLPSIEAAAASLSVELRKVPVGEPADIEAAIAGLAREGGGGLMFIPDTFTLRYRDLIIRMAVQYRLPAVYPYAHTPREGGLIGYGTDGPDLDRRAASYVDRILRGAKPADLPVQLPVKYELVINLKTAKALGLDVSPTLLAIADEVIE